MRWLVMAAVLSVAMLAPAAFIGGLPAADAQSTRPAHLVTVTNTALAVHTATAADCNPGEAGCLPTPLQCATGAYNGHWDGAVPGLFADCTGAAGHVIHYAGGYAGADGRHGLCGTVIDHDQMGASSTGWLDPNLCAPTTADPGSTTTGAAFRPAVTSSRGVVSSVSPLAAQAGIAMLDAGGNAMDAAVATVFAVGVTRPAMCGIGGGGLLVYRGANGKTAALDFRETAPAAMTPESLQVPGINEDGSGHLTVGVPGTVAGMATALSRYGTMSLAKTIEPARRMASDGIPVSAGFSTDYLYAAGVRNDVRVRRNLPAAAIYLREGLQYPPDNDLADSTLVQTDYAASLELIAEQSPTAFYTGRIAELIAADMQASRSSADPADRGLMTAADLANYRPIWRAPLTGNYRGHQVIAMPPPTAGGIFTLEILNLLEGYGLGTSIRHSSADHFHLASEAQKLAWADRNAYVADPDFASVPTATLTSKKYAAARRSEIDLATAKDYPPGSVESASPSQEGAGAAAAGHTTHVSVIDRKGNAVAVTCSLNYGFGSAVVASGTGFLLNNQLLDFGSPGTANEAEGGKRPRSSMSPTIVVKDRTPVLVTGGAGGTFIPMGVVHSILNVVDFGMDIAHAVDAPRSQEFSLAGGAEGCQLCLEDGRVAPEVIEELQARGHSVAVRGEYSPSLPHVGSAGIDPTTGLRLVVSDPREEWGAAAQR